MQNSHPTTWLIGLLFSFLLSTAAFGQNARAGLWMGTILVDAVSEVNKPLSDLSFDLQLAGVLIDEPLIAAGSPWSYDTGSDLGISWREPAFADGGWSTGPAPLGYGAGQSVATDIGFGGNPNDKFPSAYFRKSFVVADSSLYSQMRLRFRRDDGVVIYLNGVQILKDNLPTVFTGYTTLALTSIVDNLDTAGVNEETSFVEIDIPADSLIDGTNVIAAEVHQYRVTADDDDLAFDLSLVAERSNPSQTNLVGVHATGWRHYDDGDELPAVWKDPGYGEPGWKTGQAQFGFGDGDERTVVSSGPDPSNRNPVYYFRRDFAVASPSAYSHLDVSLLRDDGAVVYLNGNEILRSNMPGGSISYLTSPVEAVSSEDERRYFNAQIDASSLVTGTNVLAVEVHQHVAELTPFAGPSPPTATATSLNMRILLHVDALGHVNLLKEVIQMWQDGTLNPDGTIATPGRYVLVTDDTLIPEFKGIGPRDGALVGRRVSALGFDFPGQTEALSGSFAPGSVVSGAIVIPGNHPTHPFRHRYHPEHDNLDSIYSGPADEVAAITRAIELQLDIRYPPDPDDPVVNPPSGWGLTSLGGIYQETITGLHRDPVTVQGVVTLNRISDTAVLNE